MSKIDEYKQALVAIAAAIREKRMELTKYTLEQMPSKINGMDIISYTGQTKGINPFPVRASYKLVFYGGNSGNNSHILHHNIPPNDLMNISSIKLNGKIWTYNQPPSTSNNLKLLYTYYAHNPTTGEQYYMNSNHVFTKITLNDGKIDYTNGGIIKYVTGIVMDNTSGGTISDNYEIYSPSLAVSAANNAGLILGTSKTGIFTGYSGESIGTQLIDLGLVIILYTSHIGASNNSESPRIYVGWSMDKNYTPGTEVVYYHYTPFGDDNFDSFEPQIKITYK